MPEYNFNGERVPAHLLEQYLIAPVDQQYPYDGSGLRTGIIFGFFPKPGMKATDNGSENLDYGIVRWEADKEEGKLELAASDEDRQKYFDELAKYAPQVNRKERMTVAASVFTRHVSLETALRVAGALCLDEADRREFVRLALAKYHEHLDIILAHNMSKRSPNIGKLLENVDKLIKGGEKIGINFGFYDPAFAEKVKQAKYNIDHSDEGAEAA